MSRPIDDTLTPRNGANFPIVDGPVKFRDYATTGDLPAASAFPALTTVMVGTASPVLYFTDGAAWHPLTAGGGNLTAIIPDPNGNHTLTVGGVSYGVWMKIAAGDTNPYVDFYGTYSSTPNPIHNDNVFHLGHNIGPGGGQVIAGRSALSDAWESYFNGGHIQSERHMKWISPLGVETRFLSFEGHDDDGSTSLFIDAGDIRLGSGTNSGALPSLAINPTATQISSPNNKRFLYFDDFGASIVMQNLDPGGAVKFQFAAYNDGEFYVTTGTQAIFYLGAAQIIQWDGGGASVYSPDGHGRMLCGNGTGPSFYSAGNLIMTVQDNQVFLPQKRIYIQKDALVTDNSAASTMTLLRNTTAATAPAPQQFSPSIALTGYGWTGSANQAVSFQMQAQPDGAGGGKLSFQHSNDEGNYFEKMSITNGGVLGVSASGNTAALSLKNGASATPSAAGEVKFRSNAGFAEVSSNGGGYGQIVTEAANLVTIVGGTLQFSFGSGPIISSPGSYDITLGQAGQRVLFPDAIDLASAPSAPVSAAGHVRFRSNAGVAEVSANGGAYAAIGGGGSFLPLSGGTMTGSILMSDDTHNIGSTTARVSNIFVISVDAYNNPLVLNTNSTGILLQNNASTIFTVASTGLTGAAGKTLTMAGATTTNLAVGAAIVNGDVLATTTAAAAGAQKWSPSTVWSGNGWDSTAGASKALDWEVHSRPVQAAGNPTGDLVFSYRQNGGAWTEVFSVQALDSATVYELKGTQGIWGFRNNSNAGVLAQGTATYVYTQAGAAGDTFHFLARSDFSVGADNNTTLGTSTNRWSTLYALTHDSVASAMTFQTSLASGSSRAAFIINDTLNNVSTDKWLSLRNTANGERMFFSDGLIQSSAGGMTVAGVNSISIRVTAGLATVLSLDNTALAIANNDLAITLGASTKRFSEAWARRYAGVEQTVAAAASITLNPALGDSIRITLSATAITTINGSAGLPGELLNVRIIQDATGGRSISGWAGGANGFRLAGGAYTPTATANKIDSITFAWDATLTSWIEIGRSLNM